ncbi:hypothetical protein CROQUDRAFT_656346 [Cronartium quercuum f. sp. fusiforme G11]|uniref:Hap4 transcription factor heteromerisation domain-containing protein n=1 Tax=Cronartium quercuum f. sp. fusiforme G11 TaxID=708437 RepID=A0A9P6NHT4_9BASI|nr:hypothetical protein CROQUDRAFT_656346 [Cronartium quercuum f. sp. fusiforme G11]
MSTNKGVGSSQTPSVKTTLAAKPSPIVPASIHPDLLVSHNSGSEPRAELKSYVTKEWTIPERPKPGRKPKEPKHAPNPTLSKSNPSLDSNPALGSTTKAMTTLATSHGPKESLVAAATPAPDSNPATSLQQKYINLLEQKVESLQKEQSKEMNHYKSLATELGSRAERFQAENGVLRSQLEVLRNEVIRLRKKISLSIAKGAAGESVIIPGRPIENISRVRKEPTDEGDKCRTAGENATLKKARKHTFHLDSSSLTSLSQQVKPIPRSNTTLSQKSYLNNFKEGAHSALISTGASQFSSQDDGCGLCTSELDCVCRQVGLRPMPKTIDVSEQDMSLSISVPIRARPQAAMAPKSSVWTFTTQDETLQPAGSGLTRAVLVNPDSKRDCSGNPSDCPACCDDAFGKAFCTAISNSSSAQKLDTNSAGSMSLKIPRSDPIVDVYTSIPCCGEPKLCGSQACFEAEEREPMISCSEAWRKLKVHPNIGNANLQMLAEVVARQASSTKTIEPHGDCEEVGSSCVPMSTTFTNGRESLHEKENATDWASGPHQTLAAVFENAQEVKQGAGKGSKERFADSSPPSESEDGSGNRLIKFVAKRSLQEALVMLDGAGSLKRDR